MDYYIDHLKLLIEQNGGIVSAQDIQNAGIDRALIYDSLVKGIISKESHGNYVLADDKPDEFSLFFRTEQHCFYMGCLIVFLINWI